MSGAVDVVSSTDTAVSSSADTDVSHSVGGKVWSLLRRHRASVLACLILIVLACAANLYYTWHSPGFTTDSASYLSAAHNLVSGKGITTSFNVDTNSLHPAQAYGYHGRVPLSGYEPLYPVVLAAVHYLGFSQVGAARLIGVISIGLAVGLLCLLAHRAFGGSVPLMCGFVVLAVLGPSEWSFVKNLLQLSGTVLSEAPFDVLLLGSLLATATFLVRVRFRTLMLASVLIMLAILTRYAGISIALAAGLAIVTSKSIAIRMRVIGAFAIGCAAAIGLIGWPLLNKVLFHGPSAREFAYHLDHSLVSQTLTAVSAWLFPSSWNTWFTFPISALLLLLVAVLPLSRNFFGLLKPGTHHPPPGARALLRLCALFIPCYLYVLLITDTRVDATFVANQRILEPLQIVFYLVLLSLVYWTLRSRFAGRSHLVPQIGTVALMLVVIIPTVPAVSRQLRSQFPREQIAVEYKAVADLPASDLVFTNDTSGTYLFAHRSSVFDPVWEFVATDRFNSSFRQDLGFVGKLLREHQGVVMLVPGTFTGGSATATADDFQRYAGLVVTRRFPDGTVFLSVPSGFDAVQSVSPTPTNVP
jgi:hypothetical protein